MVASGDRLLKVSVKGSQDGGWGLTQSYIKDADYHGAVETWLKRHGVRTIFCFVQFKSVGIHELPRLYIATPEVAERLRTSAKGRGDTILYEKHAWGPRAHGAGTVEEIPPKWVFTPERLDELFREA